MMFFFTKYYLGKITTTVVLTKTFFCVVIQYASVVYVATLMYLLINGKYCLMDYGKLRTLTFRIPTSVDVCRYQKAMREMVARPVGSLVDSSMSKLALFQ